MIKEFEFYHGVVFSKLIHDSNCNVISIKLHNTKSNSSYILNDEIGIFIKYSAKRLTPWRFSFQKIHQDEISELRNNFSRVYILLVCGEDGIVTLGFEELKTILNEVHENIEWISASRNANKEYTINGSDGKLKKKIGKNDFQKKLLMPKHN